VNPSLAFSVGDVFVNEGDAGNFTVTLAAAQATQVGVTYAVAAGVAGAATPNVDYVGVPSGVLFFPAGTTTRALGVQTIGDAVADSGETVNLTFREFVGGAVSTDPPVPAAMTVVDVPNPKPAARAADACVAEGNAGLTPVTFTVNLSVASPDPVTLTHRTDSNTASSGLDFEYASGAVTVPAGATAASFTVNVLGDTTFESDESFVVWLGGGPDVVVLTPRLTGTILNDDPAPTLSIDDVSVTEGNDYTKTATFTLTQSAPLSGGYQYDVAVTPGTATALADYGPASTRLTFAAGETVKTFSVTIYGDTFTEGDETFYATVTRPQGGATIAKGVGVGTIVNDDPLTGTLRLPTAAWGTVRDNQANGTFDVVTAGGGPTIRADQFRPDYETRAVFEFDVSRVVSGQVQYVLFEYTSSNSPTAGAFPATVFAYAGNGVIELADATAGVALGSGSVNTPDSPRQSILLDRATVLALAGGSNWVGVRVQMTDRGFGAIYTPTAGPRSAPALVCGATAPVIPAISVGAASTPEYNGRFSFPITLSGPSVVPISVRYATASGPPGPGVATAGVDYTATSGVVTFQPGVTAVYAPVTVLSDTVY